MLQKLEAILPPKPKVEIPQGEHVDEVSMMEYESTKGSSGSRNPYGGARAGPAGFFSAFGGAGADEDDDDEEGAAGGQRVECNTH